LELLEKKDLELDEKVNLIFEYLKQLEQSKQEENDFKQRKRIGYKPEWCGSAKGRKGEEEMGRLSDLETKRLQGRKTVRPQDKNLKMITFITNEQLYKQVIEPIANASSFVWIGTADIKNLNGHLIVINSH